MQLMIIRHGAYNNEGAEKPLSKKGIEEIRRVAQFLKDESITANIICHSSKSRAIQSAEIVQQVLNPQASLIKKDCLSPEDSTDDIFAEITSMRENMIIVGHLPFVSVLVSRLVVGNEDKNVVPFQTGTTVVLEKDQDGQWCILSVVHPELIA